MTTLRSPPTVKAFRLGTHRVRTPAETWSRIAPARARAGITRMADVTRLDRLGIPVYQAIRPTSRSISVSQGKGVTADAARVSAAMEAIELWHAERLDGLSGTTATPREMRGVDAIELDDLPWLVPDPGVFDTMPLAWLPAEPLAGGARGWLPRALVELDFRLGETLEPRLFRVSSNGLASGNCREEALLHGLCELVERHALHLAAAEPTRKEAIDPATITADYCRETLERFRRADMRLVIYHLDCEPAVPAVFVHLVAADLARVWIGSGCHPSPDVALSRALTEAAQSRLTYISGARDDLVRHRPWQLSTPHAADARFVEPAPALDFGELDGFCGAEVSDDLAWVVERLSAAGHRPYFVDLDRDGLEVSVIKAFAAGLGEAHSA